MELHFHENILHQNTIKNKASSAGVQGSSRYSAPEYFEVTDICHYKHIPDMRSALSVEENDSSLSIALSFSPTSVECCIQFNVITVSTRTYTILIYINHHDSNVFQNIPSTPYNMFVIIILPNMK